MKDYRGKTALEIGVGSGIITESLSANFEYVIGTDLVLEPLRSCKQNDSRYHIFTNKQLKDVNGLGGCGMVDTRRKENFLAVPFGWRIGLRMTRPRARAIYSEPCSPGKESSIICSFPYSGVETSQLH